MKCYFHNDREATSFCKQCSKYLCPECYDKGSDGLCYDCSVLSVKSSNSNELSVHIKYLIISTIFFIIGVIFTIATKDVSSYEFAVITYLAIINGCAGMALYSGISLLKSFVKEISFVIIIFSIVFLVVIIAIVAIVGAVTFIPRYIYHLFMVFFILHKRKRINNF